MPACPKCGAPSVGKSKYCEVHRKEARENWKRMITQKSGVTKTREFEFVKIFHEAHLAGQVAAVAHAPRPMVVVQHRDAFDDNSEVVQQWQVNDGVCGFAWIRITPGTCSAARFGTKHCGFTKHYGGGVSKWVSEFGQSYEKKMKYAEAYASVLNQYGIKSHAGGRLD